MSEPAPAFSFYAKDFMLGTVTMSLAERGAYITLLAYQWDIGSVPNDPVARWRILSCSRREAVAIWPVISGKFCQGPDGLWRNGRLEQERLKQAARRAALVANGQKGGRPPINQTETNRLYKPKPNGNQNKSLPSPSPSSSPISDLKKEQRHTSADADFEVFRQAYPRNRRVGGTPARSAFQRSGIGRHGDSLATVLLALEQQKRSEQWQNPKLIPLMTTWLNQERWLQVLPEVGDAAGVTRTADVKTYAELQNEAYRRHTT